MNLKIDLVRVYVLLAIVLTLQACGAANAIARADTVEQKSYAAYGEFVIVSEQAAKLVSSGHLDNRSIIVIAIAEENAKKVADPMIKLTLEFGEIRAEFETFGTGEDRFVRTMDSLEDWIDRLVPLIINLQSANRGAE